MVNDADPKRNARWFWCRQVLPRSLAGRNRQIVQFRWPRRLDANRRDAHINAILGAGRWFVVHLKTKQQQRKLFNIHLLSRY